MTELLVIARGFHFTATVLAAGVVFFRLLIAEPAMRGTSGDVIGTLRIGWTRIAWIALVVTVLSGVAWLVVLAANIYGETIHDVAGQGGIFTVAVDTRFGRIWCARLVLVAAIAVLVPRPSSSRAPWNIVLLLFAAGFLASLAWVGHAGATPGINGGIHLTSDALHLLAAGAWVGSLLPLAMLLGFAHRDRRTWQAAMPRAIGRFSALGIICAGTLLITGIVNTLYLVGTLPNLVGTDYGRLVLAKIVLFAVMIGIASINKFYLTPQLAKSRAPRALQRNSLIELALGVVILSVVGVLGTMPPAAHSHVHAEYGSVAADAAFVHIHSANGMADVTIAPGRVGTSRATIRLWREDLTELPAKAVTLSLEAPELAGRPFTRRARQAADGSWGVDGISLAVDGNWIVKIQAQLAPAGRLDLDGPIVIEP